MNDATPPPPGDARGQSPLSGCDVEWLLSRHPRSVGRARRLLRERILLWEVPDGAGGDAVLLLSELVTNACWHARVPPGRGIGVRCVLRDGLLRVEVSDAGEDLPELRTASQEDESGRGLALVDALADAWDVRPRPYGIGKTVWFELKWA